MRFLGIIALLFGVLCGRGMAAETQPPLVAQFVEKHCVDCHDADTKKAGLDLSSANFDPNDAKSFALWVKVHDRVRNGEMPPKDEARPDPAAVKEFLTTVAAPLIAADLAREAQEGRSTLRRLNRYEYENTLRDLFHAPWLQVKQILPEDGESLRFNKIGDALSISHVQMAQYLSAAEYSLREIAAAQLIRPDTVTHRYYARDQKTFAHCMKFDEFNRAPERATFPVLGTKGQPDVRSGKQPITVGAADPKVRDEEGMGVVASSYEPLEMRFDHFTAPRAGHYKLRFCALSVWVGPNGSESNGPPTWWKPDLDNVSRGRRGEPITVYSQTTPRLLRWLGTFDVSPEPKTRELDVWLLKGETIRVDASRLFRSLPENWRNPLAEKDGQPGVAFRWLDVEGPLFDEWPTAGRRLLFGDLPLKTAGSSSADVEVESANPAADAERLLRRFMQRAYRRPLGEQEFQRFFQIVAGALKSGSSFQEAMFAGYAGVLCSPAFVCLEEKPGRLDDDALAARLSYFLWNSEPDDELRRLAARGELHQPKTLRVQTERLLDDPKSRRFVNAFLDYWLDLRKVDVNSPDAGLYPDYYLDDLLTESAVAETQLFFADLLHENLPARNVVSSDFAMLNERLATHYGLPPVEGAALRKVKLPADSPRGGLLTQASVLRVTANGTTTSPVVRGAWITERILGQPPDPPPPGVPAIEPDIRGAVTIRAQLELHRKSATCAACHAKFDPVGFALENFDVFGGWRDRYRAMGDGPHVVGIGKNGHVFTFHLAQPVDASGKLSDGRSFRNVRELKKLLLADERLIARNLARQLAIYATGAPIRFGDRPRIEQILDRSAESQYGIRTLILEIVQSDLFLDK